VENKFTTIGLDSPLYPPLLREISSPPNPLYIKGNVNWGNQCLAIVGTRKADEEGREIAYKMAYDLVKYGFTIVSGLAFGIDSAAHQGALDANGKTIAVLGSGIDKIYPASHINLARKILKKQGAIISEYSPHTPSFPSNFPARNRIISGFCLGVIIVQAPLKSGALITASFALEQGREVLVVPGSIKNPNYQGSYQLIKDGAKIITCAEDVLEQLGIEIETTPPPLSENEQLIFSIIKNSKKTLTIDEIVKISKLEPQLVSSTLTLLIMKDLIKETIKGYDDDL